MSEGEVSKFDYRGWELIRLTSDRLQVDVLPEKGSDILAVRWLPDDINVLWETPVGLRRKGALAPSADSITNFLENYPGGWQCIFPNGGPPVEEDGVELGFHGEACMVPWEYEIGTGAAVQLRTDLFRSPFSIQRKIELIESRMTVTETVTNIGHSAREAMWSHHPAFGAPFLSGNCRIETSAAEFVVDDERDEAFSDLPVGETLSWPHGKDRKGDDIDLAAIPDVGTKQDRFGYLRGFEEGVVSVHNPDLGLRVGLEWDLDVMPYAWFWLESHATEGFPWFGGAYVLGIEPASSYPGQGLHAVREKTGTQLRFEPDESKTAVVAMTIEG